MKSVTTLKSITAPVIPVWKIFAENTELGFYSQRVHVWAVTKTLYGADGDDENVNFFLTPEEPRIAESNVVGLTIGDLGESEGYEEPDNFLGYCEVDPSVGNLKESSIYQAESREYFEIKRKTKEKADANQKKPKT